jgi:hypothetical protein
MTILNWIQMRINRAKGYVFSRTDFTDIGGYSQVGKALKTLVEQGLLLRIGYGLYTKSRINRFTGELMPSSPGGLDGVFMEVFEKLGVPYEMDTLSQMYLDGKSPHIPASIQFTTDKKRFTRKIIVSNKAINCA